MTTLSRPWRHHDDRRLKGFLWRLVPRHRNPVATVSSIMPAVCGAGRIMGGNPVFRGTRVPVHMLAELVPSRVRAHASGLGALNLRRCRIVEFGAIGRTDDLLAELDQLPTLPMIVNQARNN